MSRFNDYLELVVLHPDATFLDYPSRFCHIRIPFSSVNSYDGGSYCKVNLSEHQIVKLRNIGLDESYNVFPYRPCDSDFVDIKSLSSSVIKSALLRCVFPLFYNR